MAAVFVDLQTDSLITGYIDLHSSDHLSSKAWEGYKVHTLRLFFVFFFVFFCSHLGFIRCIQSDTQFNSTPASRDAVFNLLRLHTCSRRADGASQSVSVLSANIRFTVWNRLLQQRGGCRGLARKGGRGSGALRMERPLKGLLPSSENKNCEIFRDPTPSGFILGKREQTHQPTGQFLSPPAQLLRNGEGSCLHPSEV